jgi:hypothetical protein
MSSSDTDFIHKSLSDGSDGEERKPESLNKSLSDEGKEQKPGAKKISTKEESSGKSTEKQPWENAQRKVIGLGDCAA